MEPTLTVQEASHLTGLSVHTLRYYEKAGLITPVTRTEGGHRLYSERDLSAITFLKKMRLTGMGIRQLREYVGAGMQGEHSLATRRSLLRQHRERVVKQIQELQESLEVIDYKLGFYDESLKHLAEGHCREDEIGERWEAYSQRRLDTKGANE